MRIFNVGAAGVVAGALFFGSVGSVSAIEPYDLSSVSLQYQREVRSTYIIQFQPGFDASEVEGRANAIAARFQGRIRHTYTRALSGFAIRMNAAAMARLLDADDLGIAKISRGVIMTVAQSNDNAAEPTKGKPGGSTGDGGGGGKASCDQTLGWNITTVTTITQDDKSCAISGIDDYSTVSSPPIVCVLDTGVSTHDDLRVGFQYSVSSPSPGVNDVYGHGTHVAGIIGAKANTIGVVGVAPGVMINSIKVLGDDGSGSDFDVIAGIDMALDPNVGCNIVNMSLGGDASIPLDRAVLKATGACTQAEKEQDSTCVNNNILFTLAAGNSAKDITDYSPARASTGVADNVFTIAAFGAARKTGVPEWASYSNFGAPDGVLGLVDFALPGSKINSTVPNNSYASYNGTSMAAPHMAGLLVRYLTDNDISFSSRVDISNDVINSTDTVQRYAGFGPFLSAEEFYEIADDK